jgi:Zn-finger protein
MYKTNPEGAYVSGGRNETWIHARECAADILKKLNEHQKFDVLPFSLRTENQVFKTPTQGMSYELFYKRASDHTSHTKVRESP